jgi:NCS2 family nucleobase:cation symporter-2
MSDLVYAQEDVPPPLQLALLSIQQGVLLFLGTMLPIILVNAIGGNQEMAVRMVSLTMMASGIGTILQALRLRSFGSGYLCPNVGGPSYLTVSMNAAMLGGLPLMQGMIVFTGFVEMLLARVVGKLRFLFPPVVVGLTVMMVGVSIIPVSFSNFLGSPMAGDAILWEDLVVGTVALLVMVGLNIWGRGNAKLYSLLLGILVGWVLALFISPFSPENYRAIAEAQLFSFPFIGLSQFKLAFDWSLALPFLVISVCGSLKTFGNLLAAQKITRPELEGPDMAPLVGGLTADGFSTALAGFMGGIAVDTSSSNVGLAAATGAVSRWIGIATGALFIVLGCFPVVAAVISAMPSAVMGAAMVFAVSFMIVTGVQEMLSEKLDQRKIFTAGLAIIFGLSSGLVPEPFAQLPEFLQPMFANPLTSTTVLAILFYHLFHADITYRQWKAMREGSQS